MTPSNPRRAQKLDCSVSTKVDSSIQATVHKPQAELALGQHVNSVLLLHLDGIYCLAQTAESSISWSLCLRLHSCSYLMFEMMQHPRHVFNEMRADLMQVRRLSEYL